jgi:hypothetical protein
MRLHYLGHCPVLRVRVCGTCPFSEGRSRPYSPSTSFPGPVTLPPGAGEATAVPRPWHIACTHSPHTFGVFVLNRACLGPVATDPSHPHVPACTGCAAASFFRLGERSVRELLFGCGRAWAVLRPSPFMTPLLFACVQYHPSNAPSGSWSCRGWTSVPTAF